MDHFTASGCRCNDYPSRTEVDYKAPRMCRGGCHRLRAFWKKNDWCKKCRKTEKYKKHLEFLKENEGLSHMEIIAKKMGSVYSGEFFKRLEAEKLGTAEHS